MATNPEVSVSNLPHTWARVCVHLPKLLARLISTWVSHGPHRRSVTFK